LPARGDKHNDDEGFNTSNDQSTKNLSAHELLAYKYILQYAFCLAHGFFLDGDHYLPITVGYIESSGMFTVSFYGKVRNNFS
jgi:hypothetical protein